MAPSATNQFEAVSADDRYARRSSRVSGLAAPPRAVLVEAGGKACTTVTGTSETRSLYTSARRLTGKSDSTGLARLL